MRIFKLHAYAICELFEAVGLWPGSLPHHPLVIGSIRKFVEERTAPVKNVPVDDVLEMKAIFASLRFEDGKSTHARPSGPIGKPITPARDRTEPDDIRSSSD